MIKDLKLLWTVNIKKAYNEWWEIFYLLLPKDSDISSPTKNLNSKMVGAKSDSVNEISESSSIWNNLVNHKSSASTDLLNMLDILSSEDVGIIFFLTH